MKKSRGENLKQSRENILEGIHRIRRVLEEINEGKEVPIPRGIPDEIPEHIPQRMLEKISERIPKRISKGIPEVNNV